MVEYDRVIMMDADGIAVNNLDHLFWIKIPNGLQVLMQT
jgi:alpha-N-acetylglucosamine transferase